MIGTGCLVLCHAGPLAQVESTGAEPALYQQVVASGYSLGEAESARLPAIGGRSGLVCAHCGFEAGSAGAFYCPKCGMRIARS